MASSASPATAAQQRASRGLWRVIWKDVLLLGTGNVGFAVGQLCFRSILIVTLVPASYGRLSLVLSIYNTIWLITSGGLPNGVARYLAMASPGDDDAITRSVIRVTAWPTVVGAAVMAAVSGLILGSPLAGLFGAVGLTSLIYSSITIGVLRGRHRIASAASVMPATGLGEVAPLALLWVSGLGVTTLSAFGSFCLGNAIGLIVGIVLMIRTMPHATPDVESSAVVPSGRRLLGFSLWLSLAATGMALLPLVVRIAASFDSYTEVAIVDITLVLFAIPQRMGALISVAMTPHASRAIYRDNVTFRISRRDHYIAIVPFVVAAAIVAFTPLMSTLFDAIGRPEYAKSATYLALVLLAGPARLLYGVAAGILIGHGEGRFLAVTVVSVTVAASAAIFIVTALGSVTIAFAMLIPAFWTIYLLALARLNRLAAVPARTQTAA
jgi:O-antigen/teichoic acid export membrane protein